MGRAREDREEKKERSERKDRQDRKDKKDHDRKIKKATAPKVAKDNKLFGGLKKSISAVSGGLKKAKDVMTQSNIGKFAYDNSPIGTLDRTVSSGLKSASSVTGKAKDIIGSMKERSINNKSLSTKDAMKGLDKEVGRNKDKIKAFSLTGLKNKKEKAVNVDNVIQEEKKKTSIFTNIKNNLMGENNAEIKEEKQIKRTVKIEKEKNKRKWIKGVDSYYSYYGEKRKGK